LLRGFRIKKHTLPVSFARCHSESFLRGSQPHRNPKTHGQFFLKKVNEIQNSIFCGKLGRGFLTLEKYSIIPHCVFKTLKESGVLRSLPFREFPAQILTRLNFPDAQPRGQPTGCCAPQKSSPAPRQSPALRWWGWLVRSRTSPPPPPTTDPLTHKPAIGGVRVVLSTSLFSGL